MARLKECPCESGEYPNAQYDARGIFLCYTCSKCEDEKLSGYRPEVLHDSQYECCEDIDEE